MGCRLSLRWGLIEKSSLSLLILGQLACSPNPARVYSVEDLGGTGAVIESFDSPFTCFESETGSMFPGEGWHPREGLGAARPEAPGSSFAWASGPKAEMHFFLFDRPRSRSLSYIARAFDYPGAPRQVVEISLNGVQLERVPLGTSWERHEIALPAPAIHWGENLLRFEFAHSGIPARRGVGSDSRRLAAAFAYLRIGDLQAEVPAGKELESCGARAQGELVLSSRFSLGLLLPPGRHRIRLGEPAGEGEQLDGRVIFEQLGAESEGWQAVAAQRLEKGRSQSAVDLVVSRRALNPVRIRYESGVTDPAAELEIVFQPPREFVTRLDAPAEPGKRAPDILVWVVDTLRFDALSWREREQPLLRELVAFAERATVFETAWATSSWTLPSVASILTGVYALDHGLMTGGTKLVPEGIPTLAELLGAAGYQTLGISQSFVVGPKFGLDRGFGRFYASNHLHGNFHEARNLVRLFAYWLAAARVGDRPLFAYLHSVEPHAPYTPPRPHPRFLEDYPGALPDGAYSPAPFVTDGHGESPQEVARLAALYRADSGQADVAFGRWLKLLEFADMLDESLIVFTSDHGEEFGEHGSFDHGRTLHREVLQVPLIVRWPERTSYRAHIEWPASHLDLMPTILGVAGSTSVPSHLAGTDLRSVASSGRGPRRALFAEIRPVASPLFAAVDYQSLTVDDTKCIQNLLGTDRFGRAESEWQVFDLRADPEEMLDSRSDSESVRFCRETMRAWLDGHRASLGRSSGGAPEVSSETIERLRSLGYLR